MPLAARATAPADVVRLAAEQNVVRKAPGATQVKRHQLSGRAARRLRGLTSQRRASLPEHWQAVVATEAAEEVRQCFAGSVFTSNAPAGARPCVATCALRGAKAARRQECLRKLEEGLVERI